MELSLDMDFSELGFGSIQNQNEEPFNARQCKNLLLTLEKRWKDIKTIIGPHVHIFLPLLEDLFRIIVKAKGVVASCIGNWQLIALLQRSNKETFREILLELEWFYNMLCEVANKKGLCTRLEREKCVQFDPCNLEEIEQDEEELYARLRNEANKAFNDSNDSKLINYILQWQSCIQQYESGVVDKMKLPLEFPLPNFGECPTILKGDNFVVVSVTTWLGFKSITKTISFEGHHANNIIEKEAHILSSLNHPNIIKVFYCGYYFESRNVGKYIIGMEKGNTNLASLLFEDKTFELSLMSKIDMMLQIASGMCYLHDVKVAHRDLKPENVVVMDFEIEKIKNGGYLHLKLIDFGTSKVKVKEYEVPTREWPYGTRGYIAPEAMRPKYGPFVEIDAFKADVFSFGMMCCDILIQDRHDFDDKDIPKNVKSKMMSLQSINCHKNLIAIIKECLIIENPSRRPLFHEICEKLKECKKVILEETIENTLVASNSKVQVWKKCSLNCIQLPQIWNMHTIWIFFVTLCENQRKSNNNYLNISNNVINFQSSLQMRIVELEKNFLQNDIVGVVGIPGIGKTTSVRNFHIYIDRKISNKNISSLYGKNSKVEASFDDISSLQNIIMWDLKNDYLVELNKILKSLDVKDEAKDLIEGKQLLAKELHIKNYLLILDDIPNFEVLQQLIDVTMFDKKRSKLIVTSRKSDVLKNYISEGGKMELLSLTKNEAMEIFSKHAFEDECSKIPYLDKISIEIVDACSGHPLSLEIVGSSLNGQTRIRVWEQALQRLKRAMICHNSNDIWTRLKPYFDDLNNKEKTMFLDIACFFSKDIWSEIIPKHTIIHFYEYEIENPNSILLSLKEKSFIKIDEYGIISIHDLLRDMGRRVSREEFDGVRKWNESNESFTNFNHEV
ncbi:uncharacterized protein [Physcomitrium patens]|uniref:Protein kinase domain-containing protein n=1 Tax=Physcomitrium patens TaxID=3218 RepID=A0A7I4D5K1_PHYPA|nr:uncharacterized protein LOC112279124 isoform X2 [Physcomitrium patens]|eukprot:XP_024369033.1 uncharacterized protein LOC112279124 isoform X2 [Physcomitrella patens]